jgi:hypothetical protein
MIHDWEWLMARIMEHEMDREMESDYDDPYSEVDFDHYAGCYMPEIDRDDHYGD